MIIEKSNKLLKKVLAYELLDLKIIKNQNIYRGELTRGESHIHTTQTATDVVGVLDMVWNYLVDISDPNDILIFYLESINIV